MRRRRGATRKHFFINILTCKINIKPSVVIGNYAILRIFAMNSRRGENTRRSPCFLLGKEYIDADFYLSFSFL